MILNIIETNKIYNIELIKEYKYKKNNYKNNKNN